ncbi:hypothetical protein EVAR_93939_1 [Eumeta japonica]|uniref:Uncharacterized protein n=1 Tax=Eumeta variegata TaxID=151549 RepID=A0A4C1TP64_EUMVA|nr:hypothetical protein EVAR_93939_1 [Eumeta japonica]
MKLTDVHIHAQVSYKASTTEAPPTLLANRHLKNESKIELMYRKFLFFANTLALGTRHSVGVNTVNAAEMCNRKLEEACAIRFTSDCSVRPPVSASAATCQRARTFSAGIKYEGKLVLNRRSQSDQYRL